MTDDKACGHDELETLRQVIAGEPARTAAAVAAAREEQRERYVIGGLDQVVDFTATPLADRIAELEHALKTAQRSQLESSSRVEVERAEKAEAERDALLVQLADAFKATGRAPGVDESLTAAVEQVVLSRAAAEERCSRWFQKAGGLTLEVASLQTEAAVLRAQVEAARKAIAFGMSMGDSNDLHVVLAAMDGAKP